MSTNQKSVESGIGAFFAASVILSSIIVSVLVYMFVMGDPSHFEGGDAELGHPHPGDILGKLVFSVSDCFKMILLWTKTKR